jgi:CheY-like chemotaxis protein
MTTILVIDDQPHLPELLSDVFTDEGYSVASAPDANAVWEYLSNTKPDLVLLDLYLDEYNGWHVLQGIKSEYPQLPVLIYTAYDGYADDPRLYQADGYLTKSFSALDALKQKVAEVLECKAVNSTK